MRGRPPNWSILTCTQLIPLLNQPKANSAIFLAACLGDASLIWYSIMLGKINVSHHIEKGA